MKSVRIIKKTLSLVTSAFAVLILSGYLSLQPIATPGTGGADNAHTVLAHHTDTAASGGACIDITMTPAGRTATDPVLSPAAEGRRAGVADSGTLDFNAFADDYQACVRETAYTADAHKLEGWTWNTNLGYVSFSCTDGVNFGGVCGSDGAGSVDYQTVVLEDGRVRGFAWADNIGYISMGCDAGSNQGVSCGSLDYGVRVALEDGEVSASSASCPGLSAGDIYGYAWADSIGWINFCGANVDINELDGFGGNNDLYGINVAIETDVGTGTDADSTISRASVVANGVDSYVIRVWVIERATGLPFDVDGNGMRLVMDNIGGDLFVAADQVLECADPDGLCVNALDYPSTWHADTNTLETVFTSVAPTLDDSVTINALDLRMVDDTSEETVVAFSLTPNYSLDFAPAVRVLRIATPNDEGVVSGTSDSVSANLYAPQEVRIWAEGPGSGRTGLLPDDGSIVITNQLYDCSNSDDYDFTLSDDETGSAGIIEASRADEDMDAPGAGVSTGDDARAGRPLNSAETHAREEAGLVANNTRGAESVCSGSGSGIVVAAGGIPLSDFNLTDGASQYVRTNLTPAGDSRGSEIMTTNALGFRTIVGYMAGGRQVRYFARMSDDGSVSDQAAWIRGDVGNYVQDVSLLPSADRIRQSLGANAKSKREAFYREIKKQIGSSGSTTNFGADNSMVLDGSELSSLSAGESGSAPEGIIYLRCDDVTGDDDPCVVILRDEDDDGDDVIEISGNITLVTIGADVFIDSNIRGAADGGRLAVIALEDLRRTDSSQRRGGNGYICASVTDVELNAVFDNTLFSYGRSETDCGGATAAAKNAQVGAGGIPLPPDAGTASLSSVFKRQLTITGSLVSNNTYGGSLATPPIIGDGSQVPLSERERARLYDINFLRWAPASHMVDAALMGGPPGELCWENSVELSESIPSTANCWEGNNPNSYGIVNIFYSPAPENQKIFNMEVKN